MTEGYSTNVYGNFSILYFCFFVFFLFIDYGICRVFFFFSSRRRHTRSLRDWSSECALPIFAANANLGLFGSRKLIDVRIPSGKPGVDGAKALEAYAANPNPDNVTLITLPRLDRATLGSAWFATLARVGATIAVQPLEREALPRWIAARLARQNQRASDEVLTYLAERCEGNLLAARQEIEKLALVLPEGEIALEAVETATTDVARYDVFQASEAWLAGDAARLVRILIALEAEGEPVTLGIWQMTEDLRAIASVHAAQRHGAPIAAAVRNARVWGRRQARSEERRVG